MDEKEKQNLQTQLGGATVAGVGAFVWDLAKILIIALVIIVPFRMLIAEPFVVSGLSMMPTYKNYDYLIIDRLSYRFSQPARGDVIVFKYPRDTSQYFIKRVIGLPGETVTCPEGKVDVTDVNGNKIELSENYLPERTQTLSCKVKQTLQSNEYFVLGDNRNASSDSRVWGVLPYNDIVGKVWARVYPFSQAKFVHTPSY